MENDTVINTAQALNDGGPGIEQTDIPAFIRVLIEQRNDALDNVSIFRTKCVRYVSQLTGLSEAHKTLMTENQDLKSKLAALETELEGYKSSDTAGSTIDHDVG